MGPPASIGITAHLPQTYRLDIDGLRAFAVIFVKVCHAGFASFAVMSGFVVASSILRDLRRDSFSFKVFYVRRARLLTQAPRVVLAFSQR